MTGPGGNVHDHGGDAGHLEGAGSRPDRLDDHVPGDERRLRCYQSVTVPASGSVTGVNFGNFKLVSIGGTKFNDLNGDGVRDPGDRVWPA